jgi:tetratricopeptide (TPR) repeat protein
MSLHDARGCPVSGATPTALLAYERALAAYQGWRRRADIEVDAALREAPAFVMAHVLKAWLLVCSRDPSRVQAARPILTRALALPSNEGERLHLVALSAALSDDYERTKARLGHVLARAPRDLLALLVAHSSDYLTGDIERLRDRVASLLPAWSPDLPGYHAVLAMHAFSLEESGDYARAEQQARAALALRADDARAHHVMAHVFEMTERPAAGVRWLEEHVRIWGEGSVVATHCWWHLALFRLSLGQRDQALQLYDDRVRLGHSHEVADLIDASALLWRIALAGGAVAVRARELAAAWAPHLDDGFCSFNDLHAMLAFVAANDWDRAARLEAVLTERQRLNTRHGATTRLLGLPACRALMAFGRGNDALAVTLLGSLPERAHRLGGSHAQRDVLHLTQRHAAERMRQPSWQAPRVVRASNARAAHC